MNWSIANFHTIRFNISALLRVVFGVLFVFGDTCADEAERLRRRDSVMRQTEAMIANRLIETVDVDYTIVAANQRNDIIGVVFAAIFLKKRVR